MQYDDMELANEALYKAQTLDPDFTMAWVGQGLLASRNGHHATSTSLFEHAVSLTSGVVCISFVCPIRTALSSH